MTVGTRQSIAGILRTAGCVYAEDEAALLMAAASSPAELATMLQRRVAGFPLEHILGWVDFCGLRIAVTPGVFVPRRRTEFLVDQAARFLTSGDTIVDLCCGCGAVGLALAGVTEHANVYAVDCDDAAVRCARDNLAAIDGHVYEGDLYEPLPAALRGHVDVLVANAPYVPTAQIRLLPPEARIHEKPVALDGGVDGLDIALRVVASARQWLAPGGHLLIETSERQAARLSRIVSEHGLRAETAAASEDFDATVVIATMPPAVSP
jgi:release factor glutamine methyltransferase